jgi:hypothetical protein
MQHYPLVVCHVIFPTPQKNVVLDKNSPFGDFPNEMFINIKRSYVLNIVCGLKREHKNLITF